MTDPIIVNGAEWAPLIVSQDTAFQIHSLLQGTGDYMVITPKQLTPEDGRTIEELIDLLIAKASISENLKGAAKGAIHAIINYFAK